MGLFLKASLAFRAINMEVIMPKGRFTKTSMGDEQLGNTRLRRVVNYDDLSYMFLNDLDRIARYFLAVAYSSVYKPTDTYNQAYIAARTVAVGRSGNKLYIAANGLKGLGSQRPRGDTRRIIIAVNEIRIGAQGLANALAEEGIGGITNIIFATNPEGDEDRTYHAEMQLVDIFHEEGVPFDGSIIGVSKPCCKNCAQSLDRVGVGYSYWHDQNVGRVKSCGPKSPWV